MDIIGKTEQLPIAEKTVAFLEETCHTSTEATTAIWPSDERRRLSMCRQGVITLDTKRHSHLQTTSASGLDKESSGTFSSLLLFRLSIQLYRLRSATRSKTSYSTPLAAHRKSSSLVRGSNRPGGFCRCVAGLFKESDSLISAIGSCFHLRLLRSSDDQIAVVASVDVWQVYARKATA